MNAFEIAKALGRPERQGPNWRTICPIHKGHSLCLRDGEIGVLVCCWGGCDSTAVLRELRRLGCLDDSRRQDLALAALPHPRELRLTDGVRRARQFWRKARPLAGTPADQYLRCRGITADENPSLRYLPDVWIDGRSFRALCAALLSPDHAVSGVQLTLLHDGGHGKANIINPRRTFGSLGHGAVRLGAAGEVLGLAEGIETALSATTMTQIPVWACLGAARMASVAIPHCVRELHVFGDADDPGRAAAERVAAGRHHFAVVKTFPPSGCKDWNDALTAKGRVA